MSRALQNRNLLRDRMAFDAQASRTYFGQVPSHENSVSFWEVRSRALQEDVPPHQSIACDNEENLREILFGSYANTDDARAHQCSCEFDEDLGGRWVRCVYHPSCSSGDTWCIGHSLGWFFDDNGRLDSVMILYFCENSSCYGFTNFAATVYFHENSHRTCNIYNFDAETSCTNCWFEGDSTLKYRCSFTGSETNEINYGDNIHPFLDEEEELRAELAKDDSAGANIGAIAAVVVVILVVVAVLFFFWLRKKQQPQQTVPVAGTGNVKPGSHGVANNTCSSSSSTNYPIQQAYPIGTVHHPGSPPYNPHATTHLKEESYAVDL